MTKTFDELLAECTQRRSENPSWQMTPEETIKFLRLGEFKYRGAVAVPPSTCPASRTSRKGNKAEHRSGRSHRTDIQEKRIDTGK